MTTSPDKSLAKGICTVGKLLRLSHLTIPDYQRPYKWTTKHVNQLFNDLNTQQAQPRYRLGTIVFHQEDTKDKPLNIVDGQQRTLTLMLAVHAIIKVHLDKLERKDINNQLKKLQTAINTFIKKQKFSSAISQQNIHDNYQELVRIVSRNEFREQHIDFLLNNCEIVYFVLSDISEAFQFFDSQNARGRNLDPHDLLKAYHLREFSEHEQELKQTTVEKWEDIPSKELAALFATYLYRIRRWSAGYNAKYFTKNEIAAFKGVNLCEHQHLPYVQALSYINSYANEHNKPFPFQLDQTIINGRRFFEMVTHYQRQLANLNKQRRLADSQAKNIIQFLNGKHQTLKYKKRHRDGDKYVKAMFDCALLFYIDKFGGHQLAPFIEKLFVWAYTLRITRYAVKFDAINKHVQTINIFKQIKTATTPADALHIDPKPVRAADYKNSKHGNNDDKDPLVILFKKLGYYEPAKTTS